MKPIFFFVVITMLASCTFEYESALLSKEEKNAIPDVSLRNLREQVYSDEVRILELESSLVRVFEGRRLQEIEGLSFTQFDDEGNITVEGKAEFASRNLDNDDILLSEAVSIYITENEFLINGEKFLFSPDQNLIWSPNDLEVELTKDDGSTFKGKGFVLDLLLQELRFDNGARGVLEESSSTPEEGK